VELSPWQSNRGLRALDRSGAPDGSANLAPVEPKPESPEYSLIGGYRWVLFMTEDVHAKYKEWSERGVRFTAAPETPGWGGTYARFEDPDRNEFGLEGFDEVRRSLETVHLVHADAEGKLAVVAILLQQGEENPLVRELWKDLPKEKEKEETLSNVQIGISRLLPSDRGYYTFSGSPTTPPCGEDVVWFALKLPTTVSATEIEQFSRLYCNGVRPTQHT